jgi:methylmalonyl-CoA/ethylmalonyl-CoA epimerase
MKFELDHIAVAVENLSLAEPFYTSLGLGPMSREKVDSEKVTVGMFELANDARIELLEPFGEESPVGKFLSKRGPGIHHICLKVEDLHATLKELKAKGVQLINSEPHVGAHNRLIAFIHPKATGGVLIELSQPQGAQS